MARWLLVVLAVAVAATTLLYISFRHSEDSLQNCPPIVDWERRLEPLADVEVDSPLDLTAFAGMPDAYCELVTEYFLAVNEAIGAEPLKRRRYYHRDRSGQPRPDGGTYFDEFPDDANPVEDRDVIVSLFVLPRPEAVQEWCSSPTAQAKGWRCGDGVFDSVGHVYGRRVVFEPGERSKTPSPYYTAEVR